MVWTVFLIPIVALVCVFTFVAVATWSDNRRKEREAYYRHETYTKMLEGPEDAGEAVRELMREEESRRERLRREGLERGLKLGGLVTVAAGAGLGIFLYFVAADEPVYLMGLIPILIGAVLTVFGFSRSLRHPAGAGGSS